MDDTSGELTMWINTGWWREAGSWFQRQGEAYL